MTTQTNGWNLQINGTRGEVQIHNVDANYQARFVGRFKYARPMLNARHFAKFLTANFTPAEFFAAHAAGTPPLRILEAKGYVSPNMARAARLTAELNAMQSSRDALAALNPHNVAARHYATGRG